MKLPSPARFTSATPPPASSQGRCLGSSVQTPRLFWAALLAAFALITCGPLARAQVTQTYTPNNWVNDTFSPDTYFTTLTGASTTSPTYTAPGGTPTTSQTLYGYSPIGATITLNAPGQTITLSGQLTLAGNGNPGNNQFRFGLYYQGANTKDTGWLGYFIGNQNSGGGAGVYARVNPNTGLYGSSTGANQIGAGKYLFASGFVGSSTYNFSLSVTYVSASSTLLSWTLQGAGGNTYLYSGIQTNNTPATQGGFSFDHVGFLGGGTLFGTTVVTDSVGLSNVLVTVGNFGNSAWTNTVSGVWSAPGNWTNAAVANGAGFGADFSQVNLAADTTATLDTSRTLGSLIFGATGGSTHNWYLAASGGSQLTLAGQVPTVSVPGIAVNQNTAFLDLSLVSSNGLAETGPGTLVLAGTNTIVGPLNLNGGELNFLSLSNLPLVSGAISSINFSNGALQWAAGNTLDISAQGIGISFAGNAGFDTGPNNLNFAGNFGDGGVGGLAKLGSGTLTLNDQVYYSGTTTVGNGTLALGASGAIPYSTNIAILAGATFDVSALSSGYTLVNQSLSGTGTVNGNVSDYPGTTIAAATTGAGTLTVNGNLSLNGSGSLNFNLASVTTAGAGVNDLIAVTGNLNISGPTTLNVSLLNGAPGLGTYTLFTYNTFSGSVTDITVPLGFSIVNDPVGKTIGLVVTHVPASLVWQGDGSANVWDTDTTKNWLQSGTNQFFFTGDSVTFTDSGSDSPAINIAANVSPAVVTVNATQTYDFTGAAIATGELIKTNTGTLILENNNTYAGPTIISGGSLQVGGNTAGGNSGTLGTGVVTNNGTLVFDLAQNYTVTTNIYGTGNLTNIGSAGTITLSGNISGGTLNSAGTAATVLSGSNSYTGQTIVFSGSVHPENNHALGAGTASIVVSNGAQLYIDVGSTITNKPLLVSGTGLTTDGALRAGGGVSTWGGVITLAGDTLFQVDATGTLYLTNAAGITGLTGDISTNLTLGAAAGGVGIITSPLKLGSGSLTKTGAGTWTIAPTNTYLGTTFLDAGTLEISAPTALGPVSAFNPAYVTISGGTLEVTTNITFADGLGGFTVGTGATFDVPVGLTLTISNQITGAGAITKADSGTLVLAGSNTITGALFVDGGGTAGDYGKVVIANSNAITGVTSPIAIRVSLGGDSTFALNGTNGGITVTQALTLAGRSPSIPGILNIAGTNTLSGGLTGETGGIQYRIESDSGLLTLGAPGTNLTFATTDPETFTFQGNGAITVAGVISDGTAPTSVAQTGNGTLTLAGVNPYSGTTTVSGGALNVSGTLGTGAVTVSAGTLTGTGIIGGTVAVAAGATFAPGAPLGPLTINNSLSLAGNTLVSVNPTLGTSSQVTGLTSVTYGGILTVTNLSGTITAASSFPLFTAAASTGNFTSITPALGGGLAWNFSPASGVLSVVATLPATPTNITTSVSGGNLTLTWPANYTGWILQAQTNALSVGLGTNWVDVAGSAATNSVTLPIVSTNPAAFFRLRHP